MGAAWTALCLGPALVLVLQPETLGLESAASLVLLGVAGLLMLRHLTHVAREAGGWQFDQEELEAVIIHLQTIQDS